MDCSCIKRFLFILWLACWYPNMSPDKTLILRWPLSPMGLLSFTVSSCCFPHLVFTLQDLRVFFPPFKFYLARCGAAHPLSFSYTESACYFIFPPLDFLLQGLVLFFPLHVLWSSSIYGDEVVFVVVTNVPPSPNVCNDSIGSDSLVFQLK